MPSAGLAPAGIMKSCQSAIAWSILSAPARRVASSISARNGAAAVSAIATGEIGASCQSWPAALK